MVPHPRRKKSFDTFVGTPQKRSASASEFLKSIKRLAMLLEVVILSTHRKMKNLLFKIFLLRFSFGKSLFSFIKSAISEYD